MVRADDTAVLANHPQQQLIFHRWMSTGLRRLDALAIEDEAVVVQRRIDSRNPLQIVLMAHHVLRIDAVAAHLLATHFLGQIAGGVGLSHHLVGAVAAA